MSIDFATIKGWEIPEGIVKQVTDASGRVLWCAVKMVKLTLTSQWDGAGDAGGSPGEENGNPLQYSCLGNPMDRGAWPASVHGIAKSQT